MADTVDKETEKIIEDEKPDYALPLRAALSNIFKYISESVSEEEFRECMTFLDPKPKVAHKLYGALIKEISDGLNAELDAMIAEGTLSEGLGNLKDRILETAENPEHVAWRPPGNVEEHLRSHDVDKYQEEIDRLQERLHEIEIDNEKLMSNVVSKRAIVKELEDKVTQTQKSGALAIVKMEKMANRLGDFMSEINSDNEDQ